MDNWRKESSSRWRKKDRVDMEFISLLLISHMKTLLLLISPKKTSPPWK
jgi:hypothetical protein